MTLFEGTSPSSTPGTVDSTQDQNDSSFTDDLTYDSTNENSFR